MKKKDQKYILFLLIFLLFVLNYQFLNNALTEFLDESEFGVVERVIDGDTIEVGNESVRLLGINSPERGQKYYLEAKDYLENLVLNETIILEFGKEKTDRYRRKLAYIYLNNQNINELLIREGFANPYFPSGRDTHYKEFISTWKECIDKNINLCEKSLDQCSNCIELEDFNYKKDRITLYNQCNFDCNLKEWSIKDEGRKIFVFEDFALNPGENIEIRVGDGEDTDGVVFWREEDYVFTRTGDSIFLRDPNEKLVLWKNY